MSAMIHLLLSVRLEWDSIDTIREGVAPVSYTHLTLPTILLV